MSKMISVAPGFQYSVNIGYDLNNVEKLQNFIPTKSSLSLMLDILQSTDNSSTERARVLIGAYGKGKSHIVLTILSILMKKEWKYFDKLSSRIEQDSLLDKTIHDYYDSEKKLLPVIINGGNTSVGQAFLLALQKTLIENDLMDVMPETNYKAALRTIEKWKSEFPDTYNSFVKEMGKPAQRIISLLENYDADTYTSFENIYPKLTAGSIFNPFVGFDIIELYESVVKGIKNKGYNGIYVVYDEFSKYLEANIKTATINDIKLLQDFAEKCNRSASLQMHILLISHKEIANYIDSLPKQKLDGWKGVSERFKHIHLNNNFSQTYEIISSVIKKSPQIWDKFLESNNDIIDSVVNLYSAHGIFADISNEDYKSTVVGCYPLHPVTMFILPRLSERVAQNERTLFTFLSSKGISTLPTFLDSYNDDCFKLITPDMIFDYFEPLFRKESYTSELYNNYILTKNILEKLEQLSLESKIIKVLSLIYILEHFDKLKPTINELDGIFSLEYSHEEISGAVENLIDNKYVVYQKVSNGFLRLKQTSGIDIKREIYNAIEKSKASFSITETLNSASLDNYIYPSRYNDEREMTRFFAFEFVDGVNITSDIDWNLKSESIEADGVIYGIIPQSEEDIEKLKRDLLLSSQKNGRFVFILPKNYSNIYDIALKFKAITELRDMSIGNDLLFDEYEVIFEDLREVISDFINSYTHPETYRSIYIYDGREQQIIRKAALSSLLSNICDVIYPKTPIINNEVINKNELSSAAFNSRNKIITSLLRNTLEPNLGFSGSGQEVSIMRSTLINKKVLVSENNMWRINLKTGDEYLDNLFAVIIEFIHSARTDDACGFDILYRNLTSYEYGIGLRKSLIPIYLAAVLHEYSRDIIIQSKFGAEILNADIILQIENNPSDYKIQFAEWTSEKEEFIKELEEIFSDYIVDEEKAFSSYEYVVKAIQRWYRELPKWSKEKIPQRRAKRYRGLIKLLRNEISGYEFLFEKLPKEFELPEFNINLIDSIDKAKQYYDKALSMLVDDLIELVREEFSASNGTINSNNSSLALIIKSWCDTIDKAAFQQVFPNGAHKCLGLLKEVTNDERTFVIRLSKLVTDLKIEDWDESVLDLFKQRLHEYRETIENFHEIEFEEFEDGIKGYSISYLADDGSTVTKKFDKIAGSSTGRLLKNAITYSIENMGQSISEGEKRQILMEILAKLC